MARKRMLSPDFWLDEELACKTPHARLLYEGLWNLADDTQATLPNRPEWIKAQIFPYESVSIRQLLGELSATRHIALFRGEDGKEYWFLPHFHEHQKIDKPSKPKYPQYVEANCIEYNPTLGEDSARTPAQYKLSKDKLSEVNIIPPTPQGAEGEEKLILETGRRLTKWFSEQEDVKNPVALAKKYISKYPIKIIASALDHSNCTDRSMFSEIIKHKLNQKK
jgi:hypothetical protein